MEGEKVKKPIFKRWWFWLIIGLVVLTIIGALAGGGETNNSSDSSGSSSATNSSTTDAPSEKDTIDYEKVSIKELYDELNANALNAKTKYEDKYIEFDGYVTNIDSDGNYIYVSKGLDFADTLATNNMLCYTSNKYWDKDKYDNQIATISSLNINAEVTIRGKVKSVGEALGYSVDIIEIIIK